MLTFVQSTGYSTYTNQHLTAFRGDTVSLVVPTEWNGAAFDPEAVGSSLLFTVKASINEADAAAKIQKSDGAGCEITGSGATSVTVSLVPADSTSLDLNRDYEFDVVWQSSAGVVRTIARGLLKFIADVSINTTASVTIYTTSASTARVINLFSLTGLTGGTATDLDSLTTTGTSAYPVGTIVVLSYSDTAQQWKLRAGTEAEAETGGIVRPDDYATTTNEKVWVQIA